MLKKLMNFCGKYASKIMIVITIFAVLSIIAKAFISEIFNLAFIICCLAQFAIFLNKINYLLNK